MGKIKNCAIKPKISLPNKSTILSQGCISEQYPWFSFRYVTTNSAHSLKFLEKLEANGREITLTGLYKKLEELSKEPWRYWTQNRKSSGLETINYSELNFQVSNFPELTKDTSIYVFRFDTYQGTGKGRLLGFKLSPCSVFHIIGYDFDFSAYKH